MSSQQFALLPVSNSRVFSPWVVDRDAVLLADFLGIVSQFAHDIILG